MAAACLDASMGVEEKVKLEGMADAGVDHSACTASRAKTRSANVFLFTKTRLQQSSPFASCLPTPTPSSALLPTWQDVAAAVAVLLVLWQGEEAGVVPLLHHDKSDGGRVCREGSQKGRGRRQGRGHGHSKRCKWTAQRGRAVSHKRTGTLQSSAPAFWGVVLALCWACSHSAPGSPMSLHASRTALYSL